MPISPPAKQIPYVLVDSSTGAAIWWQGAVPQCTFKATADPGVNDDSAAGWDVGSWWFNISGNKLWILKDKAVSAAVWDQVYPGSGGGSGVTIGSPVTGGSGSAILYEDVLSNVAELTPAKSITVVSSSLVLVNDSLAPGNSYYYGTDSGGTKGFFALPGGSSVSIGDAIGSSTNYNILDIDGANRLAQINPSSSGLVLTSNGVSAASTFQLATLSIGGTNGTTSIINGGSYDLLSVDGTNLVSQISPGSLGDVLFSNGISSPAGFNTPPWVKVASGSPSDGVVIVGNSGGSNWLAVTLSGDATVDNTGVATLKNTGPGAGIYTTGAALTGGGNNGSITLDNQGRITAITQAS